MCSCSCSRSPYDRPQCTLRIVHYNSVHSELYNRLLAMRCQSAPVLSWHAPCRRSPCTACTKSRAQDFWCSGYREHSLEHTSPSSQLPAMKIWSFVQVWMCVPGSLSCCPAAARTGVPSQLCSGPLDSTTQTSIPRACGNTHAVLNAARSSIHFSVIQ